MKITKNFIAIAAAMIVFTSASYAQVTAYATTTATFVTPLSITKLTDMNFGLLASSSLGTAVISTAGVVTPSGGVTLPSGGDPKTAASFTVTGESASTYSITTPVSITLTGAGPTASTLTVNQIVTSPTPAGALTTGTQTIYVGATLMVPQGTPADIYTNTAVDNTGLYVTVNYN